MGRGLWKRETHHHPEQAPRLGGEAGSEPTQEVRGWGSLGPAGLNVTWKRLVEAEAATCVGGELGLISFHRTSKRTGKTEGAVNSTCHLAVGPGTVHPHTGDPFPDTPPPKAL